MARVQTVVAQPPAIPSKPQKILLLDPSEIEISDEMQKARPGPVARNEQNAIEDLARSLRTVGQIVPVVVEKSNDNYKLIDGMRRYQAASLIPGFKLQCVVSTTDDALQQAIHANLKRRGYNHLQFAYLCQELRRAYGWEGTAEVSKFLSVSRAQISQHDKLLHKPPNVAEEQYQELLQKVATGGFAAEGAFYLLTHIEPAQIPAVMERAEVLSKDNTEPLPTSDPAPNDPASSGKREKASGKTPKTPVRTPEWMKEQKRKSKERREAKVTGKHVKQAAIELDAVKKGSKPLSKTIADFERVFNQMMGTSYPDPMRNLASFLINEWRNGNATDNELMTRWNQLAVIIGPKIEKEERKKK